MEDEQVSLRDRNTRVSFFFRSSFEITFPFVRLFTKTERNHLPGEDVGHVFSKKWVSEDLPGVFLFHCSGKTKVVLFRLAVSPGVCLRRYESELRSYAFLQ